MILACTVRLRGMSERRSWRWTRGLRMCGRRTLAIIVGGMVVMVASVVVESRAAMRFTFQMVLFSFCERVLAGTWGCTTCRMRGRRTLVIIVGGMVFFCDE